MIGNDLSEIDFDSSKRTNIRPNYVLDNTSNTWYKWKGYNGNSNMKLENLEDGTSFYPSGKKKDRFSYYINAEDNGRPREYETNNNYETNKNKDLNDQLSKLQNEFNQLKINNNKLKKENDKLKKANDEQYYNKTTINYKETTYKINKK